jgi:protein-disulfide isomerase
MVRAASGLLPTTSRRTRPISSSARRALLAAIASLALLAGGASAQDPGQSGKTSAEEERLAAKIKAQLLRELETSDWFYEQVEKSIDRYVAKVKAAQEAAASENARQASARASQVRRVRAERDHIRGNPGAEISLIEYSDFECPFCKSFHETTRGLMQTHGAEINWVYRHLPLSFHNPGAQREAEAAECAFALTGDAGFWAYADAVFARTTSNGRGFPESRLVPLAKEQGLDVREFRKCLASGRHAERIRQDAEEARHLGISGTPTTVLLNNRTGEARLMVGALSLAELNAAVEKMLAAPAQAGKAGREGAPSRAKPGE